MQGMTPLSESSVPNEATKVENDDVSSVDTMNDDEEPHSETDLLCQTRASTVFDAVASIKSGRNSPVVKMTNRNIPITPQRSRSSATALSAKFGKGSMYDVSGLLSSKRQRVESNDHDPGNDFLWASQRKKRRSAALATLPREDSSTKRSRSDRDTELYKESIKKRRK